MEVEPRTTRDARELVERHRPIEVTFDVVDDAEDASVVLGTHARQLAAAKTSSIAPLGTYGQFQRHGQTYCNHLALIIPSYF